MKFLFKIIPVVCFFASVNYAFGQKQFFEGTISYTISIQTSKSEAPVSNSLNGAALNLYIKPFQSRSEMKSALGTETNVYDNKTGKGFILKEYSGQKLMITVNKENWTLKNQWSDNMNFTLSDETENIAGYKCKRAVGTTADGRNFTVYFAPDIIVINKKYNNSFGQLPGLPVQYELKSGNLIFKYTLNSINYEPVASAKFDAPKTGFRIMTYEENKQLKKGE